MKWFNRRPSRSKLELQLFLAQGAIAGKDAALAAADEFAQDRETMILRMRAEVSDLRGHAAQAERRAIRAEAKAAQAEADFAEAADTVQAWVMWYQANIPALDDADRLGEDITNGAVDEPTTSMPIYRQLAGADAPSPELVAELYKPRKWEDNTGAIAALATGLHRLGDAA